VQNQLNRMPEHFLFDTLLERLIVLDKIQWGTKDTEDGNTFTEEELDEEMEKWFEPIS
jgi:predicted transcriptional regulator